MSSVRFGTSNRNTSFRPTAARRSCSSAAKVCVCSMPKGANISTCWRASVSARWATATKGWRKAIAEQAREMIHCSNLFFHPLQGQVAERLAKLSGLSRAFFCNSGAEAVEACLKFARRYWFTKGVAGRTEILAMKRDFHGRTYGALSTTYDEHYRAPFAPLLP